MSATFENFPGEIVLSASLQAKSGNGDQIAKLLAAIKESALSEQEPDSIDFRVARSGDHFTVWEKYTGVAGVKHHFATEQFKSLAVASDLLAVPLSVAFYEEL